MQKEFFQELQDILYEKNITIKFHSFQNFYEDFKSHKLSLTLTQILGIFFLSLELS